MLSAMSAKTDQLQIRVTPEQKATLKRLAHKSGQGVSSYVLSRVLPPAGLRLNEVVRALADEGEERFVLAEFNDLLTNLASVEFTSAVAGIEVGDLSTYFQNYVAAMVEQAAEQKDSVPPAWVREVEPLERPHFAAPLPTLRPYLLKVAPVPYRRRNIFVDSSVGDRV